MADNIKVTCTHCSKSFNASPQYFGRTVKCPNCGSDIQIPAGKEEPPQSSQPPNLSPKAPTPKPQPKQKPYPPDEVAKSKLTFTLLGIFLGGFGAHNFYAGRDKKASIPLCVSVVAIMIGKIWITLPVVAAMYAWAIFETGSITTDSRDLPFLNAAYERNRVLQEAKSQSSQIVAEAKLQSSQIITEANQKAEKFTAEALEAKDRKEELERVAQAIKNIIDGYGDQYVEPAQGILDELAEDWGHKEAGARLKEVRARSRRMVKDNEAATCDCVDTYRRETAVRFAVDAFNGRVDAILAKVKHNNIGTLKEKITDIFTLVNQNGGAFNNVRIEPAYLAIRLEELHWAVATQELKRQEREEQKAIRDQMREEEKAKRELEKAQKAAQKEEDTLGKAMAQAEAKLAAAHADQREKYEQELAKLQQELTEAHEKNQRAISMAQQTKRGHVYVISNIGSFGEGVFKVGLTRRLEPLDRVKELGDASVPFPFDVHAMIYSEDSPALEAEIHRVLADQQVNKVNPRKEFFRTSLQQIREIIEEKELEVHWTMHAEAMQFRESRALEEKKTQNLEADTAMVNANN